MIEAANRSGYASATVSSVIANAGVSRPTFYDYFKDRDDCFRASVAEAAQQLDATVRQALEAQPPERASASAIEAVLAFAREQPDAARFLAAEAMAGGAGALDIRDRALADAAQAISVREAQAAPQTPVPDLDPRVLLGAVQRFLGSRLRRGELALPPLAGELQEWTGSYERTRARRRWQTLAPGPKLARSPYVPEIPIQRMPGVLPPGRPRLPEHEIAENHRLRILYATARLAEEKGYSATTVGDIAKLASVDGRSFYRHFSDKQDAFAAVHELGFQQLMDVTGRAYFSVEGWPARCWEAGRALTQLMADNPLVAHVGFVEAYAVGPSAVQRVEDSHTAFMFFLQEGLVQDGALTPSRVAMEAVIHAVFEIIYLQTRAGGEAQLARMLAPIAHIWLTPFLGLERADAFIEAQLKQEKASMRKRSR
jgi:AcrR family transcriptional regulator